MGIRSAGMYVHRWVLGFLSLCYTMCRCVRVGGRGLIPRWAVSCFSGPPAAVGLHRLPVALTEGASGRSGARGTVRLAGRSLWLALAV